MREDIKISLIMASIGFVLFHVMFFITVGCFSLLSNDFNKAVDKYKQEQISKDKEAYNAWVKVTGNKKNLTFNEWKALKDTNFLPKDVSK